MATLKRIYRTFYLEGREDVIENGLETSIDLGLIADRVLDGDTMYEATLGSAKAALAPLYNTERREWLSDHETEVAGAGGNGALAFEQFMLGRTDEFRLTIEAEVVDVMRDTLEASPDKAERATSNADEEEEEDDEDDDEDGDDDDDDEEEEEDEEDES